MPPAEASLPLIPHMSEHSLGSAAAAVAVLKLRPETHWSKALVSAIEQALSDAQARGGVVSARVLGRPRDALGPWVCCGGGGCPNGLATNRVRRCRSGLPWGAHS